MYRRFWRACTGFRVAGVWLARWFMGVDVRCRSNTGISCMANQNCTKTTRMLTNKTTLYPLASLSFQAVHCFILGW